MAIRKKAAVAKSADAARKSAMTKTVVKKVSPDVKIIKAGSKPLTQSLTEKRAIMEKAQGKTPAKRAQAAITKKVQAKNVKRSQGVERSYVLRETAREALKNAGFDTNKMGMGDKPTAAQVKAMNKAIADAERQYKKGLTARNARNKAERAAKAQAARGKVGGGGVRGPLGGFGGGGVGGPFGKMD